MSCLYVVRHAQSEANVGNQVIDAPLTKYGVKQASELKGHFDLVICSVMQRTKQTLENSQITYENLIYSDDAREMKSHIGDFLPGESLEYETTKDLMKRLQKLRRLIHEKNKDHKKILLVSHWNTLIHLTATNTEDLIKGIGYPNGIGLENAEMVEFGL